MTDLEQILASGQPYFGTVLLANQGSAYFPYFRNVIESIPREPLTILEIGSWAGNSLNAWDEASNKTANFIAIDAWAEYLPDDNAHAVQNFAARSGGIERLFWHNMETTGIINRLKVHKGDSKQILPTLESDSVDIVFIDGNHSYEYVKHDILNSARLIRKGGFVCGDDLLRQVHEVQDLEHCKSVVSNGGQFTLDADGVGYHPGVAMAVAEIFGQVQTFDRLWMVQR